MKLTDAALTSSLDHTTKFRHAHAEFEPELPSQIDLPEGWEQPSEEKTAVQKFLYPDEDELTSDFAVSPSLMTGAASMTGCS